MDGTELITVGQLARHVGLTAKALRHYDRVGLLAPARVDPGTGYRFYRAEQVAPRAAGADAALGRRAAGPGPGVSGRRRSDEAAIRAVLADHRRRLQARLDRLRGDRPPHGSSDRGRDRHRPWATDDSGGRGTAGGRRAALAVDLFNGVWRLLEREDRRSRTTTAWCTWRTPRATTGGRSAPR